jgi:hypothetical protein
MVIPGCSATQLWSTQRQNLALVGELNISILGEGWVMRGVEKGVLTAVTGEEDSIGEERVNGRFLERGFFYFFNFLAFFIRKEEQV